MESDDKYYLRIVDENQMLYPSCTVDFKGIFKLFGGRFNKRFKQWVIDVNNLEDNDIIYLRWLISKLLKSKWYENIFDIEIWRVDKEGKSEKIRSLIQEVNGGLYPDGKLVLQKE